MTRHNWRTVSPLQDNQLEDDPGMKKRGNTLDIVAISQTWRHAIESVYSLSFAVHFSQLPL